MILFLSVSAGLRKDVISASKAQPRRGERGARAQQSISSMPLVDSGRQDWSVFCSYFLQDGFVAGEAKGVSA